jgi:hypothetical protein
MLGKPVLFGLVLVLAAACQSSSVDTQQGDGPAPPATPPAPSPSVTALDDTGAGSATTVAQAVSPAAYNGTFRGEVLGGPTIEVEIRDADTTGARINHLLAPQGPLLPGQAVWRNGAFSATMEQGTFVYTPAGANQLLYEGPGPAGTPVAVVLTRI